MTNTTTDSDRPRVPTLTEAYEVGYDDGAGSMQMRLNAVTAALTDVIEDMRQRAPHYGPATRLVFECMADRYEKLLREATA